jgi:hypothetical protein
MKNIPILALAAIASFFIPSAVGIFRFRSLTTSVKLFAMFYFLTCAEELVELYLALNHIHNIFLINYSFLIEPVFLSVVYFVWAKEKWLKQLIAIPGILYIMIWLANKLYFGSPDEVNNPMAMASRIVLISVSIFVLHSMMKDVDIVLFAEPLFWISTGWILYSTGVLLIYGLSADLLKAGVKYFTSAWYINWSLAIVSNLMFTKGLICKPKS